MELIEPLKYGNGEFLLLDQTKLPTEETYITIKNKEELWEAIVKLRVRGAPAIGIAAAFGTTCFADELKTDSVEEFSKEVHAITKYLSTSRPTAVNLFWALDRMNKVVDINQDQPVAKIKELLKKEAEDIYEEDADICKRIGENALEYIKDGMTVLTHCNAGGIATAKYGTALAPIYLAKEKGMNIKVYADETRPLLQGARLTAWELSKAGVDVTLITDNMAAMVMSQGKIDAVIVGCDRVSANGDVANKIGTYGVAVLAKEHNIPFYVACPLSTIDLNTKEGKDIEIEERASEEITNGFGRQTAPDGVKTYNPAFDVTPQRFVTAIITEKGVVAGDYQNQLPKLFGN